MFRKRKELLETLAVLEAKLDYLTTVVDLLVMHHDMSQPLPPIYRLGNLDTYYNGAPTE